MKVCLWQMSWLNSTCHPAAIAGTTTPALHTRPRRTGQIPSTGAISPRGSRWHTNMTVYRDGSAGNGRRATDMPCYVDIRSVLFQGTYQRQIGDMPLPRFITTRTQWLFRASPGGRLTNASRAPQNNLTKIHNARNNTYGENPKPKPRTWAQSIALGTRTKLRPDTLITSTASQIHKFRENIPESPRNISETSPRPHCLMGSNI